MPYRVTFVSSLFSADGADREVSNAVLQVLLDTLVKVNVLIMQFCAKKGRPIPLLHQSGVRYVAEKRGVEDWRDCLEALRLGNEDCEGLAAWRAAELRVRYGIDARARFKFWQNPQTLEQRYHCVVIYGVPTGGVRWVPQNAKLQPDGRHEEDPSKDLGMVGSS